MQFCSLRFLGEQPGQTTNENLQEKLTDVNHETVVVLQSLDVRISNKVVDGFDLAREFPFCKVPVALFGSSPRRPNQDGDGQLPIPRGLEIADNLLECVVEGRFGDFFKVVVENGGEWGLRGDDEILREAKLLPSRDIIFEAV